jgi:hypothetical protein
MDFNTHIDLCHRRLSQIWKLIQDLQADGVPEDSPAFDILEEKAELWLSQLESLGALDVGRKLPIEIGNIHLN